MDTHLSLIFHIQSQVSFKDKFIPSSKFTLKYIFPMPPKTTKNSTAEPDPNHAWTRAHNADVHPGTLSKDALRVWNPPQDPDIVEKEKMKKISKKEEKKRTVEETHAKEETATHFIEEYCARKATDTLNEDVTIPHQKIKGQYQSIFH